LDSSRKTVDPPFFTGSTTPPSQLLPGGKEAKVKHGGGESPNAMQSLSQGGRAVKGVFEPARGLVTREGGSKSQYGWKRWSNRYKPGGLGRVDMKEYYVFTSSTTLLHAMISLS